MTASDALAAPRPHPRVEAARRAADGRWVLWRWIDDVSLGIARPQALEGAPAHRRWVIVAVARHRRDLWRHRRRRRGGKAAGTSAGAAGAGTGSGRSRSTRAVFPRGAEE